MAKQGQVRARYTAEFKQESVRLVQAGESIAAVSRNIAVSEQTLYNWVKAVRDGQLSEAESPVVTPEKMELGGFNRSSQHSIVEQIVYIYSALRQVLSS
ncbi:transposase [Glaciimonas sp. GS1]|uniref:Transposase n=1 Tax=Glaciimonas soli TaxID=2590999 RepID=A0A843YTD8_9BURK|nr:transposase [Glaciimonas soli]MQR01267.1 transposase [Glaciimonas soli]